MARSTTTETYVACRPGLLQQIQAAFSGMDVEVDETMTTDYEFRQRELTGMDLVMAELEAEERMAADPKHAHTYIVPLTEDGIPDDLIEYTGLRYLAVRVQDDHSQLAIQADLKGVKPVRTFDGYPDVSATIAEVRQSLKDAGYNVLSISEAEGLTILGG